MSNEKKFIMMDVINYLKNDLNWELQKILYYLNISSVSYNNMCQGKISTFKLENFLHLINLLKDEGKTDLIKTCLKIVFDQDERIGL